MIKLEYSYLSLPEKFYELIRPSQFKNPEVIIFNEALLEELNIKFENRKALISFLMEAKSTFAQAYAGHQFGYFTKLGDGRAIMLGEYETSLKERFDIQLKGSGRTKYSRSGDGKATLKSMLREYLMSEAIHYLNIPSSRSLSVLKTGQMVQRETIHDGAILARIMKSHIRVGTFEYARHFGSTEDLQALTDYTINRLYPEIRYEENQALGLLKKLMSVQIDLVVNWMRVGFIHGVMNTDNVSISGETFDYGPCAFMNTYHPDTVYSSIDTYGRYAFGNQPKIIKWNISRFAEALLPILHSEPQKSIQIAQDCIDEFDEKWNKSYYRMMLHKLGIADDSEDLYPLVDELLRLMQSLHLDYTNTFLALTEDRITEESPMNSMEFKQWMKRWENIINSSIGFEKARKMMRVSNPAFIPRNNLVEEALDSAIDKDFTLFDKLLDVIKDPYHFQESLIHFTFPPHKDFERNYATFCGT